MTLQSAGAGALDALGRCDGAALIEFGLDLRCTAAVGGALARLGIDESDLVGRTAYEVFGSAGAELERVCAQAMAEASGETGEVDWTTDDHTAYATRGVAVRDDAGALIGGLLLLWDVSDRSSRERSTAESDRELRAVIELSGDLLSRTDPDGMFLYASPRFEQVLGYRSEQLIGRQLSDFAHPDDLAHFKAGTRNVRATGSGEVEYRVRHADGHYVWVHTLLRGRYDEQGRLVEVIRAARDISAQRAAEEALARSERELRAVTEQSADVLVRYDTTGAIVYISPGVTRTAGYHPEEIVGRRPIEFVHREDRRRVAAASREVRARGEAEVEHRVIRPDGGLVWVQARLRSRRDEDGRVAEVVASVRDISERKLQESLCREATERFERAFEHAPIGMALVDLDARWLKVNRELCRITGYSERELLSKRVFDITHPDDLDLTLDGLNGLQAGERFESEKRYVHADGHVIWVHVAFSVICDEHGTPQHLVTQTQDITERKQLTAQLGYLADHDSLTELYNRRRFETELERQITRSRRYEETAAVVMLDLDHFKYLNDALGHHVGDQAILHAARVLSGRLRESDVLARLGGDEYAVILPRVDATRARLVANELVCAIEATPFQHDGHRYELSASAGVVLLDGQATTAEDALVNVDLAIYDAKQHGRNRAAVYCPDTREDILDGLSWSQRLKHAVASGAFELNAQPIVDLRTRETEILELLIRMRIDGELILPARFLHAAARFGYMPAIDRCVIAHAARLAAAKPGRCLAVNLAANTIAEPGLVAYITSTLTDASADPADLVFELSETDVIANLEHARTVCERLRALGARIALDDFGSGFSGFSYLKALTVDLLKIDGQFVRELDSNPIDQLVVEAIVHVASGIGIPTIAEYATSQSIVDRLRELNVSYAQGFHLGKPTPLTDPSPNRRAA